MEPDIRQLMHFGTNWMRKHGMKARLEIGFERIESPSDYFAVFSGGRLHIVFNTRVMARFERKDYEYALLREIRKFAALGTDSQMPQARHHKKR